MTETELLTLAVKTNPQLWHAVQATAKVRDAGVPFPIASQDGLLGAFGAGAHKVTLKDVSFTRNQLEEFFPIAFYPITDEADLFGKLYASLLHGRTVHEAEAKLAAAKKHISLNGVKL